MNEEVSERRLKARKVAREIIEYIDLRDALDRMFIRALQQIQARRGDPRIVACRVLDNPEVKDLIEKLREKEGRCQVVNQQPEKG